jgi:hypothetical protein
MQIDSVERAIHRAHKRANHAAQALAKAETARAISRHRRRLGYLRQAEREAITTAIAYGFDLEDDGRVALAALSEGARRDIAEGVEA